MNRRPLLRSTAALLASVMLTFVVFHETATVPADMGTPSRAHARFA